MIQAINTFYHGYKFRSRLEARWAVIFDNLKIQWKYEVEGFEWQECQQKNEFQPTFRYLPDFFLPELNIHAEVKGNPTLDDIKLLASAAVPHWGLPGGLDDRILILGEIPEDGCAPHGVMLHWHKGEIYWYIWTPERMAGYAVMNWDSVYGDNSDFHPKVASEIIAALVFERVPCYDSKILRASMAGRHARFEHGQRP